MKLFLFRSDNKRMKSKRFGSIYRFWITQKRSTLPKTISRSYQIALQRPRTFRPKWKRPACDDIFFNQIKVFCFCSDNKRTKSKCFAYVTFWIKQKRSTLHQIISRPNQIALLRPRIFWAKRETLCLQNNFLWTKSKCSAFVPIVSGPNQNVLLSFR